MCRVQVNQKIRFSKIDKDFSNGNLKKVNLFIDTAKCPYFQRLMPHPYLGYVYGPRETCEDSIEVTNKLGFLGEELPPKRSNENFYVMLVGGSVAQQLGNMSIKQQNGGLLSYSFY